MPVFIYWLGDATESEYNQSLLDSDNMLHIPEGECCEHIVSKHLYDVVVKHFASTRMIGRAVPCPGCDWDGCVDCNPELEPAEPADRYTPDHPQWLSPVNLAAIHAAIDEIEARMSE